VEAIASQWPLLAGFLTLYGSSLAVIRALYERERADLKTTIAEGRADLKEEKTISRDATAIVDKLSDRLDAVLKLYEQQARERT